MKMKFGMPTLIEYNSLEENMSLCNKLQLSFLELNMNFPYCLPENIDINKVKKLKDQYKLDFTMHFPEEIDFGSPYIEIQKANIDLFKRFLEYGSKLGVSKINIHVSSGVITTLPHKKVYMYELELDNYIKRLKKALEMLVKLAYPYQIDVCVENTICPPFMKKVFLSLKDIEGLAFTYDTGHDAKENFIMDPIYQILGDKVKHMHLHDYDKITDHQILFKGIINIYERIEFAKRNNMTVLIEVKTIEALSKSVENLKMRHLF
ncbi:MAG TPA: sugar phosphate isomerase/epimerase [Haloplasmataceae bacterium]